MKKFNPEHHRQSTRLRSYNYSLPGAYFVTICAHERAAHTFGEIANNDSYLTDAGWMLNDEWLALPKRFPSVELDWFVIMPNHFHGIVLTNSSTTHEPTPELGDIIGAFKSITTVEYI